MYRLLYVDHESNLRETKNDNINADTDQKGQWVKKRRQESYGTIRDKKRQYTNTMHHHLI